MFFFFFSVGLQSQSFDGYSIYIMDSIYNMTCKMPKKFTDLHFMESFSKEDPYFHDTVDLILYCPVIQSPDAHCIIMYFIPFYITPKEQAFYDRFNRAINKKIGNRHLSHRYQMNAHLKGISGTDTFIFSDYVTVWPQTESLAQFNADSVFVFNIPVPAGQPYRNKYTHSMAMFISKYDRPYIWTIWFFTDKGYKNRKKYLSAFNKTIWYKDGWMPDEEKIREGWNCWCNDKRLIPQ